MTAYSKWEKYYTDNVYQIVVIEKPVFKNRFPILCYQGNNFVLANDYDDYDAVKSKQIIHVLN